MKTLKPMLLLIAALCATLQWNNVKAATLCEDYGGTYFYFTVGAGTAYPKASDLIPSSTNINFPIYISGDFEIDKTCKFLNNVVKVAPGVKITVKSGSYYTFTLDNTKIFACGGLWKGISVGYSAILTSTNNTQIEDAEKAINTIENAYITVNNTTFNRNDIGIDINPTNGYPILTISTNVKFTCTSALNGGGISFAGIKTNNFNLSVGSSAGSYIVFDGLQNGIYNETTGNPTSLTGRKLEVKNIETDGIYLKYGTLDLDGCKWTNNLTRGATVKIAKNVTIKNSEINYTTAMPAPTTLIYRWGIYLEAFAGKALVNINNNTYDSQVGTNSGNVMVGIYLKGGNVGEGIKIDINQNDFTAKQTDGVGNIYIDGVFPSDSKINIYDNYFDSYGVSVVAENGDKNYLKIYDNEFTYIQSIYEAVFRNPIILLGSSGLNNEVINNTMTSLTNVGSFDGVILDGFSNLKICSNTVTLNYSSTTLIQHTGFDFYNLNPGTDFRDNEIYGTDIGVDLYTTSLMGVQTHKGNRWYDGTGGLRSTWHARCQTTSIWPSFSKFTVHTPKTVWNGTSYTYFSEYFRENISPNNTSFFETDLGGTPAAGCSSSQRMAFESESETDELDLAIANNFIPIPDDKPAYAWMLKDFLYKKLKRIPTAVSENSSFASFLANESNTSLAKLYDVSKIIENALSIDVESLTAMERLQLEETEIIQQIIALNEQIAITTESDQLEAYQKTKNALLEKLYASQAEYQKWYIKYKNTVKEQFKLAKNQNNRVEENILAASNEKEVNDVVLTAFIEQDGKFNEEQIARLKKVALQCPNEGGMAVYNARGFLPTEVQLELWNEFPCTRNWLIPFANETRGIELANVKLEEAVESFARLYPNPSKSSFMVNNPEEKQGIIIITDLTGKVMQRENLNGQASIEIMHNLSNGVYLVSLQFEDGAAITEKLVVQKN